MPRSDGSTISSIADLMFTWPEGEGGALSLTFDDGLDSHRDVVVPMLEDLGLRATFYVNPSGSEDDPDLDASWKDRLEGWSRAAALGHEIGNHSVLHPCSLNIDTGREWGVKVPSLRDWDLERIGSDIQEAQRRIAATFPRQSATSFAYPCYETSVGAGANRASYVPLVAGGFVAARGNGELSGELANDPEVCDLHLLSSYPVEHQRGELMIGLAEAAAARGRWSIFTFHGIDEGPLSVSRSALREFLSHLVRRRGWLWVAPVADVAGAVAVARGQT
jgi:peptidoglycan-N-acetylglucosamine deacetylase